MEPDRYGVAGHPVAHSWSPFIQGLFARETGQHMSYRLYDFAPPEFDSRVGEFFTGGGRGLNVTVPFKVEAARLARELTPRARQAGAVNTLVLRDDGSILGDNTDGAGLVRDLCGNLGLVIIRRRILIVGAGGATRGAIGPLLALEPAELSLLNRTPERAREMAEAFGKLGCVQALDPREFKGEPFDLVINATSASLRGEVPVIPAAAVGPQTVCYDMSYGKSDTAFTQWARERGCAVAVQGWGMLVEQAAESFRIWRGVRPATAPVLAALRERALSAS